MGKIEYANQFDLAYKLTELGRIYAQALEKNAELDKFTKKHKNYKGKD